MDELSLLHVEGDQNNGKVTLKLVQLDFLDLDAISRPISSQVESTPSVAMQNINQTSSIAPGGTIESGDASPLNTTSSPVRLASGPLEAVGSHHGLPASKMIVDCGSPPAQMTAIPKSNYQKQQHPSPRSEIPISEQRLKTVSSFVNDVQPVAPLPSLTDTRKRVATQPFSGSGLMILPSKFRLPLNRDTPPPTASDRGGARSIDELDCRDRDHPHKWHENRPRGKKTV